MFPDDLPYDFGALEPVVSRQTVMHHVFQHHRGCYEQTAALVRGTGLEGLPLEGLIRVSAVRPGCARLFRQATEAWNHDLYWNSLRPGGGGSPYGPIGKRIRKSFGGFPGFVRRATEAAASLIGSGWLWLTWKAGRLEILTTENTDTPIVHGRTALLAIDLWEHAYYLDYCNGRMAYVAACLEGVINWNFANTRLCAAELTRWESRPIRRDSARGPHLVLCSSSEPASQGPEAQFRGSRHPAPTSQPPPASATDSPRNPS
jgi:superoxide dismutase, Fe-Mn family